MKSLLASSPRLRRALWKGWYEFAAKRLKIDEWTFMNYGYAGDEDVPLDEVDEPNRWSIQLYHHATGGLDLSALDVLDVGSGRGGGSAYFAKYLRPRSVLGVDYSSHAVALSRRLHAAVPNLAFLQGDAEALPSRDGSFDAVVNVESSHCYGSMERFLAEAVRVMRPGGHLLWVDMRAPDAREVVRIQFEAAGLAVVQDEDITRNVVSALDRVGERNDAIIAERIPRFLAGYFRHFAGVPGTRVYESLRSGAVAYLRLAARKPS
jgi:SAM-dependent methyltransferase